jgi:hypothetical protein
VSYLRIPSTRPLNFLPAAGYSVLRIKKCAVWLQLHFPDYSSKRCYFVKHFTDNMILSAQDMFSSFICWVIIQNSNSHIQSSSQRWGKVSLSFSYFYILSSHTVPYPNSESVKKFLNWRWFIPWKINKTEGFWNKCNSIIILRDFALVHIFLVWNNSI